jgi:hypothetical protein
MVKLLCLTSKAFPGSSFFNSENVNHPMQFSTVFFVKERTFEASPLPRVAP